MIYQKLPERVIYGLFRPNSKLEFIKAKVFMEDAEEYRDHNLAVNLKNQLNLHFLYRNNNYQIQSASLVPKNDQIGVEFTDCLLGICNLIIQNKSLIDGQGKLNSKVLLSKALLVDDVLPSLRQILKQACVFELCGQDQLVRRNFDTFLRPFEAKMFNFKNSFPEYDQDGYKKIVPKD